MVSIHLSGRLPKMTFKACEMPGSHSSFDVLLAVHLSIFISVINQIDAQNFCFTVSLFHASTCFEHHVLIMRRSKLYYTASGIITPVGGHPVHALFVPYTSSPTFTAVGVHSAFVSVTTLCSVVGGY